jgi:short-subunit dehydrogenase
VHHPPQVALITGASSGFGAEFARRLAAAGADVVLVARRQDRLEALADELGSAHGTRAHVIVADLAVTGAAAALVDELDASGIVVDALVNNAGLGIDGPLSDADPGRLRDLLQVNVVALTELTRLLLPSLIAAPRGMLINVSSTAAYQPLPSIAVYAASKAYVRSLTDALWHECRGTGVRVLAIAPGPTETEFFAAAGSERFKVGQMLSAGQVVDMTLRHIDKGARRPSRIAGWRNAVAAHANRLVPTRVSLSVSARLTGD